MPTIVEFPTTVFGIAMDKTVVQEGFAYQGHDIIAARQDNGWHVEMRRTCPKCIIHEAVFHFVPQQLGMSFEVAAVLVRKGCERCQAVSNRHL